MDKIRIEPVAHPVQVSITPPGSKSITNRALLCAALADGTSRLSGALDSDDTAVMIDSLIKLGVPVRRESDTIWVDGCGGSWANRKAELFVKNSGTTIRFLTAALGIGGGEYHVDGIQRMRERPIGDLVDAISQLGGNLSATSPGGCPPVVIDSERASGGTAIVKGNISSQYLSGLLMAAPLAEGDLQFEISGKLISVPYVEMTLEVMRSFGVHVDVELDHDNVPRKFAIHSQATYQCSDYRIEPDASAASYFLATAAICGGSATVHGLHKNALQGDVNFARVLEQMGCEVLWGDDFITVRGKAKIGIEVDMADISDTAQTLAVVALFVDGSTTISGIAHNRIKETDRIGNLAIELRKLGASIDEHEDGFTVNPRPLHGAEIETYDDHRMAMSLSLVGLRQAGVVICEPGCVAKTYPNFFADMESVRH